MDDIESSMQSALEHFKKKLSTLRTNKANPSMLDTVTVEVYGTKMRLKDISHVTTPEPRQLLITPFDTNNVSAIDKAIKEANINLQPIVDGNQIRITIQLMSEDMRKEIVKQAKKLSEEAKIAIRDIRRKNNENIKKEKQKGDVSEDEVKRKEKDVQEKTDLFIKKIDEILSTKEKEILAI